MRRSVFFFLLFSVLFISSCKKDLLHLQKVMQLSSNTNFRLHHVRFVSNDVCVIDGGDTWTHTLVLKSTDGGYTFLEPSFPELTIAMQGMYVSPWGAIYMCGTDGKVLYTKDTCQSWHYGTVANYPFYVGVAFPAPDTGVLLQTHLQQDGTITQIDSNYNVIDIKAFKYGLNDIYMTSASTAYVVGYGAVLKTTDYRRTWNYLDVKGDNFNAMDIHGDEIWMCGYNGSIYHTANGGNSWSTLRNGNDIILPHYYLQTIVFKDELNGWAAGEDGKLIHTDDGGQHWEEYAQFTTSAIFSLALCPNGDLIAAGDHGALYRITP